MLYINFIGVYCFIIGLYFDKTQAYCYILFLSLENVGHMQDVIGIRIILTGFYT